MVSANHASSNKQIFSEVIIQKGEKPHLWAMPDILLSIEKIISKTVL